MYTYTHTNMYGLLCIPDDQFDWKRQNRPTSTGSTGPASDHTSGKGYYLFIEASAPRRNGQKARIQSPTIAKQK